MLRKTTRSRYRLLLALAPLVMLTLAACEDIIGPPPVSTAEYDRMLRRNPPAYPEHTVFCYNLRRVCDSSLPAGARVESLKLAARLRPDDPDMLRILADLVRRPETPKRLQYSLLELLMRKGYPGVADYAVKVLEATDMPTELRDAVVGWLMVHAGPEILPQVVKLWAQEESATGVNEPRYRQIVERIAGEKWEEALLDGINSEGFFARGSALEILAARMDSDALRTRIRAVTPATVPMLALQSFARQFDYVPRNRGDFITVTAIYGTSRAMMTDAAYLNRRWQKESGYRFDIRDFHLLSRLASDPLRKELSRSDLIVEISRAVTYRMHVRAQTPGRARAGRRSASFASQVDRLTMADLWNLYLLNEMLERPRVQIALKTTAGYDLDDESSAWGGLVSYENGRAKATLYPPVVEGGRNDLVYKPSQKCQADARDVMCRFHAHFEQVANAARAGPDARELREAEEANFYGLVLTSINAGTFAAHYYNPRGIVVSLGNLPFGLQVQ